MGYYYYNFFLSPLFSQKWNMPLVSVVFVLQVIVSVVLPRLQCCLVVMYFMFNWSQECCFCHLFHMKPRVHPKSVSDSGSRARRRRCALQLLFPTVCLRASRRRRVFRLGGTPPHSLCARYPIKRQESCVSRSCYLSPHCVAHTTAFPFGGASPNLVWTAIFSRRIGMKHHRVCC